MTLLQRSLYNMRVKKQAAYHHITLAEAFTSSFITSLTLCCVFGYYLYILLRAHSYVVEKDRAIEESIREEEARRAVKFIGVPNK